jgi:hypothetical protein
MQNSNIENKYTTLEVTKLLQTEQSQQEANDSVNRIDFFNRHKDGEGG